MIKEANNTKTPKTTAFEWLWYSPISQETTPNFPQASASLLVVSFTLKSNFDWHLAAADAAAFGAGLK